MNTLEDSWLNASTIYPREKKYSSPTNETAYFDFDQLEENPSMVPLPQENFDPYLDEYNQVDDFLTQTLSSLQDLDIPTGEKLPNNSKTDQYTNFSHSSYLKGHKKKPSGTAIFGFANHNKTLSIPSLDQRPTTTKALAPNVIFTETEPQVKQQQPVLFQSPHELEMAQRSYYEASQTQPQQVFPPKIPVFNAGEKASVPYSYQQQHPYQQPQPHIHYAPQQLNHQHFQQQQQRESDFVVTNKAPSNYKFPPSPPSHQAHLTQQQQHPPINATQSQSLSHYNSQKTVQVPVEYLQKLTSMIQNTEGIDMQKFMNYEFDQLHLPQNQLQQSHPQQQPPLQQSRSMEPQMLSHQQSQANYPQSTNSTTVNTRETTPESQIMPSEVQSVPGSQQQTLNSSPPIGLGLKYNVSKPQGQEISTQYSDTLESEFREAPKTPSPTLKSQAKFQNSSPIKNELSWTPVIIGGDKATSRISIHNSLKRKPHDKISTLPPGEIDQYIIGPTEEKTFICNFDGCGKLFTRRYNVRSHVQTHLSDRPFFCDAEGCSKAFVRQHDLTRHRKIHEEFNFQCPCGKKFSRHDALFRHRIRRICAGGLDKDDVLMNSNVSSSIRKVASTSKKGKIARGNIRVPNDQVAKRLEFDLLKFSNKKKSINEESPSQSNSEANIEPNSHSNQPITDDEQDNVFLNTFDFDKLDSNNNRFV